MGAYDAAMVLLTRVPVPGRVKTRLLPAVGAEGATDLMRAMALDEMELLSGAFRRVTVRLSDEWRTVDGGVSLRDAFVDDLLSACASGCDLEVLPQEGAGLGARMASSLDFELGRGAPSCMLVGSDLPEMSTKELACCARALTTSDVVLGEGADGGYWLVGLRRPFDELFEVGGYGSSTVLTRTLERCATGGRSVVRGPVVGDVDDASDLERIWERVVGDPSWGAPRTARVLKGLMGGVATHGHGDHERNGS